MYAKSYGGKFPMILFFFVQPENPQSTLVCKLPAKFATLSGEHVTLSAFLVSVAINLKITFSQTMFEKAVIEAFSRPV